MPYFAFAWIVVASQLLLFAEPRKAVTYLGVSVLLAFLTAEVMAAIAPYYRLSALVWQGTTDMRRADILIGQSAEFALQASGILILAVIIRPQKPAMDMWAWATFLAAILLVTLLGWHAGNYLVYYYQLLLGPLIVVALRRLVHWPSFGRVLLCGNLLVLGCLLPSQPGNDQWEKLAASVAATPGPILADPFFEPLARSHPGLELFAHGQTASILSALDQLGPRVPMSYVGLHQELLRAVEHQTARIRAREFAAIYVSYIVHREGRQTWGYDRRHTLEALFSSYQPVDEILFYPYAAPYWDRSAHGHFPYHVVKWVPK